MAIRVGPGPVFVYESLLVARRWQVYAGRACFLLVVLIGLSMAWLSVTTSSSTRLAGRSSPSLQAMARAGEEFFAALAGIQLALVLLAAPAAAAGAICQDRARGILTQLAVTDLSDAEIVLGKLGSRLAPILGLLACVLPVTALATLLGGIDPQALVSLFAVSVAIAVLGCSLALAISVRAAKAHEVIMAVFTVWFVWLLSLPIWAGAARSTKSAAPPDWFQKANPFLLVYAPYSSPGYVGPADVAWFVIATLLISALLVARTIVLLRRSVVGQQSDRWSSIGRRLARLGIRSWHRLIWLPGPSLDGNPVLWREWHRNRPSRLARLIWAIYGLGSVLATGVGIRQAMRHGVGMGSTLFTALGLQFVFGLLLLCVMAPTSLAEERVRGSLDVLLSTPLSTRSIAWGKWLGAYRVVLALAILPTIAAAVMATLAPPVPTQFTRAAGRGWPPVNPLTFADRIIAPCIVAGEMLCYGAAITSLGLALATWIPRLGRAVAANVITFMLISIGWPLLMVVFWPSLQTWLEPASIIIGTDRQWLRTGMEVISPLAAPDDIMAWLVAFGGTHRDWFWLCALAWNVLASVFAALVFWATVRTFDLYLVRMPETTGGGPDRKARPRNRRHSRRRLVLPARR